jgi:hypothetical protein
MLCAAPYLVFFDLNLKYCSSVTFLRVKEDYICHHGKDHIHMNAEGYGCGVAHGGFGVAYCLARLSSAR